MKTRIRRHIEKSLLILLALLCCSLAFANIALTETNEGESSSEGEQEYGDLWYRRAMPGYCNGPICYPPTPAAYWVDCGEGETVEFTPDEASIYAGYSAEELCIIFGGENSSEEEEIPEGYYTPFGNDQFSSADSTEYDPEEEARPPFPAF